MWESKEVCDDEGGTSICDPVMVPSTFGQSSCTQGKSDCEHVVVAVVAVVAGVVLGVTIANRNEAGESKSKASSSTNNVIQSFNRNNALEPEGIWTINAAF